MFKNKLYYIIALLIASFSSLKAQILLTDSPGTGFTTSYFGSYNLGYQFLVGDTSLSVSSLGFYDLGLDGLANNHQVGLWRTDGSLLASVNISRGLHLLDHGFAFENLAAPVLLDANTEYILSAYWPSPADRVYADFFAGSQPLFIGATLVGSRLNPLGDSELKFPTISSTNGFAWIGANLTYTPVPEPSTYALFGGMFLVGLTIVNSRRRRLRSVATEAASL